ncbi:leucine-rich repeat-containing protein 17-like [Notothenia coriiceps]|uniref:Leucine-rich repeat-containing protein 17-like n=1 Tax=Notothenia coriiceps TaxID=8208 RepID=A0A6I9PL74_9TELE|nr:PREDICTED: leucine-rich repeat-containing protein 17-like [Notothenia coriiceps]
MRLLITLLLLLLLRSAEPRRGPRSGAMERGARGRVRGRDRAGVMRRQTQECKEYIEAGEKYLDCQDKQLTAVMQHWPKDIHHLLLARNKIQVLRDNMCSQFSQTEKTWDLAAEPHLDGGRTGAFPASQSFTTLAPLSSAHSGRPPLTGGLLPLPRLTLTPRLYEHPGPANCQLDSLVTVHVQCLARTWATTQVRAAVRIAKIRRSIQVGQRTSAGSGGGTKGLQPDPKRQRHVHVPQSTMVPQTLAGLRNKDLNNIPSDLPSDLVKMDLSRNTIKHLRPKQFLLSKDLKLLNLSSNSLQHIDTAAFAGLLHLRELDLSNNTLHYFQYGVLEDLYFIRKLSLDNNPWICDYNIHYLNYWLKHHPNVFHSGLICSEPPEFRGWRVEDYVKTYNSECPKDKQTGGGDTGQGGQGGTNNEAVGEMGERQEEGQPQPLQEKKQKGIEIIRLS